MSSLSIIAASRPRERRKDAPASKTRIVHVGKRPGEKTRGVLRFGPLELACALGRSGIGAMKREGDGRTPRAPLRVLGGFFRPARWPRAHRRPWVAALPETGLGWCDAPADARYNRPVRLPFAASHEVLARDDGLYDCVIVLDWNIAPRARNRGSAIFLHLARPGFRPTEGCIALTRAGMARLITRLRPGDIISVT